MGTRCTDMSLDDILMNSNDLIDKRELDCGGFGQVYLCFHRQHGLVVQKTVYTGYKQDSYKNDLLQEGKIMNRLNHERVVKLLGVILEDSNYSLVIEYMTKGNLLNVLKQTKVPISVKARFILEIIEGMVYLHCEKVIHKDLKPENILANDDFHVKIADLGVAAFQRWSCLTKEETNRNRNRNLSRKSNSTKAACAGTLSYMAPEHFKSINTRPTEKSDVYSFAIVIWVILNDKEPYENVMNDEQLSLGVKQGQRPDATDDVSYCLNEAAELMNHCWKNDPNDRPSFQDCEKQFRPVYTEKYEKHIEQDMAALKETYPEPQAFIRRMASLQLDCDAEPPSMPARDNPMSLHSSMGVTEGTMDENIFCASKNEPIEHEDEKHNETLQRKLEVEMNYHLSGSRIENATNTSSPATSSEGRQIPFNNPSGLHPPGSVRPFNDPCASDKPILETSGYAYGNVINSPEMYGSDSNNAEHGVRSPHQIGLNSYFTANVTGPMVNPYEQYEAQQRSSNFASQLSTKVAVPESEMLHPYAPYANPTYDRNLSHPDRTTGNDVFPKGNFEYSGFNDPEKSYNLTISNSRAFQIGNYNYMVVDGASSMKKIQDVQNPNPMYQNMFENQSLVNDVQLQLLRDNLSKKWKEFARIVGFRQPEIDEIDYDYDRDGLKEKVVQMLYRWEMKEGSKNATVGKIAKALYDMGEAELLNKLMHLNKPV